jgi:hypothetical protein
MATSGTGMIGQYAGHSLTTRVEAAGTHDDFGAPEISETWRLKLQPI